LDQPIFKQIAGLGKKNSFQYRERRSFDIVYPAGNKILILHESGMYLDISDIDCI